ncbi:G-D-S-L family lipolytic protein [Rhodococcus pyridinivorans AK37]|uniref:G-D-S-L family lipolytic protein n=2 Tax=Rhodococcus pyridinivorans TaxID=103816 RepID=H0JL33_9NOCA|nr:G-D-S-L family lipolytic protein [Rhodococcus pyridinivorans AK37]
MGLSGSQQNIAVLVLVVVTAMAAVVGVIYSQSRNQQAQAAARSAPTMTIETEPEPYYPRLVVVGDSYSIPNQTSSEWPRKLATERGWRLTNMAVGGVGYVQQNLDKGKKAFTGNVDAIVALAPDYVIIAGGRNDVSYPRETGPAAAQMFATLKEQLPESRIIVIGMIHDNRAPTPTAVEVNATIRREAEAAGLPFVDALTENWLSDPALLREDGMHPTAEGQAVLRDRINEHLARLGI